MKVENESRTRTAPARRRKKVIALLAAVFLITGGAIAWAAVTVEGRGQTTVNTGDASDGAAPSSGGLGLKVSPQDGIADLKRNERRPFSVEVANPNDFPVKLKSLSGISAATDECGSHAVELEELTSAELNAIVVPAQGSLSVSAVIFRKDWARGVCSGLDLPFDVVVTADAIMEEQ